MNYLVIMPCSTRSLYSMKKQDIVVRESCVPGAVVVGQQQQQRHNKGTHTSGLCFKLHYCSHQKHKCIPHHKHPFDGLGHSADLSSARHGQWAADAWERERKRETTGTAWGGDNRSMCPAGMRARVHGYPPMQCGSDGRPFNRPPNGIPVRPGSSFNENNDLTSAAHHS